MKTKLKQGDISQLVQLEINAGTNEIGRLLGADTVTVRGIITAVGEDYLEIQTRRHPHQRDTITRQIPYDAIRSYEFLVTVKYSTPVRVIKNVPKK